MRKTNLHARARCALKLSKASRINERARPQVRRRPASASSSGCRPRRFLVALRVVGLAFLHLRRGPRPAGPSASRSPTWQTEPKCSTVP
eukprot:11026010-Alexandrium_andersonii.AAC.2